VHARSVRWRGSEWAHPSREMVPDARSRLWPNGRGQSRAPSRACGLYLGVIDYATLLLRGRFRQELPERWLSREHAFSGADRGYSSKLSPQFAVNPPREAFPTVPRAPIASRASFWSPPVPQLMSIASS